MFGCFAVVFLLLAAVYVVFFWRGACLLIVVFSVCLCLFGFCVFFCCGCCDSDLSYYCGCLWVAVGVYVYYSGYVVGCCLLCICCCGCCFVCLLLMYACVRCCYCSVYCLCVNCVRFDVFDVVCGLLLMFIGWPFSVCC